MYNDIESRLFCIHYVPSNVDCAECHAAEKDYDNRPLYAPLFVPLNNLSNAIDSSQIKLPSNFYLPLDENVSTRKLKNHSMNSKRTGDFIEMETKNGIVRVPCSTLVHRSRSNQIDSCNNNLSTNAMNYQSQQTFPGDFEKHAHRFTRSFAWKTKQEEPPFAHMQPLPKLIKRPDYIEICCKNICWPAHQFCLCCGRNTAESCRKWSKSTGEYNFIDACWSTCALCSDDAYKILNTPVVYNEKIIDPEVLLPLDAELLYYSIQSEKRQQEKRLSPNLEIQKQSLPTIVEDKKIPETLPIVKSTNEILVKSNEHKNVSVQKQQTKPLKSKDKKKRKYSKTKSQQSNQRRIKKSKTPSKQVKRKS